MKHRRNGTTKKTCSQVEGGGIAERVQPELEPEFQIDPLFQKLLPPQTPGELAKLEQLLATNGCTEPLATWCDNGTTFLIDGHTRFDICRRRRFPYSVTTLDLPNRAAVVEWIWEHHFGRRNLTRQAQSYFRGRRFNAAKRHGGDHRSRTAKAQIALLKQTAKAIASEFKVSSATIKRDGMFTEALEKITAVCPDTGDEFRRRLLAQSLKVSVQTVRAMAGKPKGEMERLAKQFLLGEKPDLGVAKTDTVIRVALRCDDPRGQATALLESLGAVSVGKLVEKLNHLLQEVRDQVGENGAKEKQGRRTDG